MMLSTGKVDPFALCNILCNSTVDNLCDPSGVLLWHRTPLPPSAVASGGARARSRRD